MVLVLASIRRFYRTGPDRPLTSLEPSAITTDYERKRRNVFWSVTIGYGLFYTCRLSLSISKDSMLTAAVFDAAQLGLIGALLKFSYAFGKFTNGILVDHCNIRRFMATGLLASAMANLILGFSSVFWIFLGLWAINGWFQSMGSAPSVVSLTQWFSHRERGTRYGVWSTSHCIGEALTWIGTAAVISIFGWRVGFLAPGTLCVLGAIVLFRTLADRPQTYGLPSVAEYKRDFIRPASGSELSVGRKQFEVLKNPWVWILALSSALMYVSRYGIDDWIIVFFRRHKGYELVDAGIVTMLGPLFGGLLGSIASGIVSDRLFNARRNWPTLIYGLLQVGSLLALYLIPPGNPGWDAVAIIFFGFATGGLLVFLGGLMAVDIVPKRAVGAAMGIVGMFSYIGAGLQEVISGWLIEDSARVAPDTLIKIVPDILQGQFFHAGAIAAIEPLDYSFDAAFALWIGASICSLLLACCAWRVTPRE